MTICRFSRDLPANLAGYAIWLQLQHDGNWHNVCCLRPADARQLLRWADRQILPPRVRVSMEPLGIR